MHGLLKLLNRLKLKPYNYITVKDLSTLHDRHLNRPTLDDSVAEEHAIEIQTQEITQVCCLNENYLGIIT